MKIEGGVAGYFNHLASLLALSRFVQTQDIHTQIRTSTEGFLRGDVMFKDRTRLHFRELVTTEPTVQEISYTYHYMHADGTLIFRYDDADHYPHLPTAPHHKHIGEHEVIAAHPPDLQSVLEEIEGMMDRQIHE